MERIKDLYIRACGEQLAPQSSSASRFIAGAAAFFILSQSDDGRQSPCVSTDAFEAHLAGMGEDGRAVALEPVT
jgi:hypothetical protein